MDQFTSVLAEAGHLLLLDCRTHRTESIAMRDGQVSVLIINTNVKHELAGGEYARRRAQCEQAARVLGVPALRDATFDLLAGKKEQLDPVVFRRARHVISENERTVAAARAISNSDWSRVGELMYASHASLREDYEVTCLELDSVVELAQSLGARGGVIGCRMTGGGFGGCAVALVRAPSVEEIQRTLRQEYRSRTGIDPSMFVTHPAAGAQVLGQR
jgi:galactokinase